MQDTISNSKNLVGGSFLIQDSDSKDIFIPELLTEDQEMIKNMVIDFIANEIRPIENKIEKQEDQLTEKLLVKAGELCLLGAHMPQEFGGMELDTNTNTLLCDYLGPANSWSVSFAAHTGIGMLPILYFGTEEQKNKYLPGLITDI